jgi:hypothetical protein
MERRGSRRSRRGFVVSAGSAELVAVAGGAPPLVWAATVTFAPFLRLTR